MTRRGLCEALDAADGEQGAHLCDGDVVEGGEACGLWQSLADEHGVEAFEVGEDDELLQRGVVADVSLGTGVGIAPLFGGLAEEGDVEQIRLAGIDGSGLRLGDERRNEGILDGVGVDAVVDLGKGALEVPIELEAIVFLVLEALEFLDEVELELRAEPGAELKGDVLVGVGAATVATGFGLESDGTRGFDPLSGREGKAIQAGLVSKGFEFETFECWIVNLFPDADEFEGVAVAHPVVDEHIVPEFFRHVGQRDEIARVIRNDSNGCPLDIDAVFLGFAHGISGSGKSEGFMRIGKAVQIAIFRTGLVLLNGWLLTVFRHRGSGLWDF